MELYLHSPIRLCGMVLRYVDTFFLITGFVCFYELGLSAYYSLTSCHTDLQNC